MTRGLQSPSSTIQRAWHRIGNRIRKAIQPVPNAYEDEAQTIGGRKTHGDKSDGFYRKARPPATYTQPLPSRSVLPRLDTSCNPPLTSCRRCGTLYYVVACPSCLDS